MNYKKLFGVVLLAVLTSNSYGQLFYKITSPQKKNVSYLFGTMHGSWSIITIPDIVKEYLKQSNTLYLEVLEAESKSDRATKLAAPYATYPAGKSLKDYLSADQYDQLKQAFLKVGMSEDKFDNEASTLTPYVTYPIYCSLRHKTQQYEGLDFKLERFARQNGLRDIRTFETEAELAHLHGLNAKKYTPLYFLNNLDSIYNNAVQTDNAYIKKDLAAIGKLASDSLSVYRNKSWMVKLKPELERKHIFIAVGAAHLPGKGGLLELLKESGCQVEPIYADFMVITPIVNNAP
jgi:uncharacterized protein YbaP (TraB family)